MQISCIKGGDARGGLTLLLSDPFPRLGHNCLQGSPESVSPIDPEREGRDSISLLRSMESGPIKITGRRKGIHARTFLLAPLTEAPGHLPNHLIRLLACHSAESQTPVFLNTCGSGVEHPHQNNLAAPPRFGDVKPMKSDSKMQGLRPNVCSILLWGLLLTSLALGVFNFLKHSSARDFQMVGGPTATAYVLDHSSGRVTFLVQGEIYSVTSVDPFHLEGKELSADDLSRLVLTAEENQSGRAAASL